MSFCYSTEQRPMKQFENINRVGNKTRMAFAYRRTKTAILHLTAVAEH